MSTDNSYDFLKDATQDAAGYEGLDMDTMAIPFIRIIQSLSPQLKKAKSEYIAEAEEGMLVNTVTSKLYTAPLRFVVGKFERLFIEWKPNRGGFVQALSPDQVVNNPRYVMKQDGYDLIDAETMNELVETYMYYIVLPDHPEDGICLLSLSSTQLKEAKKLNRMLMTTLIPGTQKKAAPYFMIWTFNVVEMSNDKGDWMAPAFSFDSFVTQDLLENVTEERKALPDKKVDYAQIEENSGAAKKDVDAKF